MKFIYKRLENWFEKLVGVATRAYGNSITFILALITVGYYISSPKFYKQSFHDCIKDIILCTTFLSFFIIQKAVNRFSTALHLKVNELVAAHDKASNKMINIEEKSEMELQELAQHYSTLVEKIEEAGDSASSHSINHILEEKAKEEEK